MPLMHFTCISCGKKVKLVAPGTKNRNHCPYCLFSLHVDDKPGDRASECRGIMHPVGKTYKEDGEEMLVNKCAKCGFLRKNRIAGDDSYEALDSLPKVDSLSFL